MSFYSIHKLSLLLFGVCGIYSKVYAGSVEAKKDNVEVLSTAGKDGSVIAKLNKGDVLTSGERTGMYWQVTMKDGKTGFVSVMAVKIKAGEGGGINDAIRNAVKEGRAAGEESGARSRSAVMGVRGLDDNNTAMAGSVRPNLRAVYSMEDLSLSNQKLEQQSGIVENDILSRLKKN
jgi:hypothetical protein